MSLDQIKQVFTLPGVDRTFESKAEAADYLRRPKVLEALNKLTEGNAELNTWLFDNRESVEMAFETGTIKRVTKQEAKKLGEALDYIANTLAGDKKAAFVVENIAAVKDSFRWPTVKRMTDEEKATAAAENILRNAIRHSPPEGIVSLDGRREGNMWHLWLDDQGAGVAPEELERIFAPFTRLDGSRPGDGGFGLGLSIARNALRLQGGSLWAENHGGGLRVHVRLLAGHAA